jgi:uncharacterized membrane protein
MKIVCPHCSATNDTQHKTCVSCAAELQFNLTSAFQLDNGKVVSIVDMLGKVEQLETRLVFVEKNYQSANVEKLKAVLPDKTKVAFSVPAILPTTIEALRRLLVRVNVEKQVAKNDSKATLFADLDFDSKKIEKRIQRLEQQKEVKAPVIEKVVKIETPKQEVVKSYPETVEGLKKALKELEVKRGLANVNYDTKGLEDLLVIETEMKRRLKHLELAEMYGKDDEVEEPKVIEVVKKETISEGTKNLIFEIEQELAAIWSAKQRAKITQDALRFGILSDKELLLKKKLEKAKKGEIQTGSDSTSPEAVSKPKETNVVSTSPEAVSKPKEEKVVSATPKVIPRKKPVAVKVIKPKKEGPSALEEFFAPLVSAVSVVEKKYKKYEKEGKLSLFFLTVAGIVTLLFGFGFLAQYSAVTYFGKYLAQLKVGFGFVCSSAAIVIGIRLIKQDRKFEEFGQALMGLGLSLNYLFIYFLSADPPLVGSTVGFVLIMINTAVSVVLSLRYESKIIAVLALLGGALAPSYLKSTGESTHIYFAYLWLLCASSAYTAKRLSWDVLNFISFILVLLILGRSTYFNYADAQGLPDIMYLLLFHAFGYLYAYLSLFDGLKPQKEQSAMNVITLIGAQGAMLGSLYFVYGNQQEAYATLTVAYLFNMIPFALITAVFYEQWNERQKSILIGISSAFVAAAIPAYFGIQYRGLLWASQGIMLLSGGLIFKLPIVRRLAYLVLLGGLANMFVNLDWHSMPSRSVGVLFTAGYINLWSIGLVLIIVSFLLKKYETALEKHEEAIPTVLNEGLSVWGLFIFYITTFFLFERYALNLAIIPLFALLVWNNYRKLYLAEVLGLLQMIAFVLVILISMDDVHSYHFIDQRIYGQLGIIEILAVLWGLKLFYAKVLPEVPAYKHDLAAKTQDVFYILLPLVLLDTFYHIFIGLIGPYAYNLALIPMFILLTWTKYRKSNFTEILGLLQLVALVFVLLSSMYNVHSYHFADQRLYGQLSVIEILAVLWGLKLFYAKVLPEAAEFKHTLAAKVQDAFYIILPLVLLDTFYDVLLEAIGKYAYNLALIPMFTLLIWNKYRKSSFTEILGLLQVFMLALAVIISMSRVNSYHFSDQLLFGQLGMIEILFVLWFMKLFYEKVFPEAPAYKHAVAARVREGFYVILPLAILSAFHHNMPAHLLYGFWIAAGLSFILAEFTKSKVVLVEFLGLVAISIFLTFGSFELGPLIVGNVLLLGIGFYKKAWTEEAFEKLDYQVLYFVLPYFFAISGGLAYYILSNDDAFSAMQLVALVLLTMVNLGSTLVPIRKTLDIAYRLAWGLSFVALLVLFGYASNGSSGPTTVLIGFVLLGGVLAWSYKMIYKADIPYNGNQQSFLWQAESVTIHILTILSYATLLCTLTGDATSLGLTIAFFIHGIALVFNGLSPKYTHLKNVYIPLFAVAMIKLFFVDMKDADTVMKIIVFIIVGISCLLAAYFLIKYNDKNKPVVSSVVDSTVDLEITKETKEDDTTETDELE